MRLALLAIVLIPSLIIADEPDEKGFTPLFTGKDLTGWVMAQGKDSLDGKEASPTKRFVVKDSVLVIDPKVKGDIVMNTAKSYAGDVVIRFEFKPGEGCNNDLLFRGTKFDLKKEDVKNIKFGEWNRFEISIQGDKAEFRCNGELLKTLKAKPAATPLGLRAEFGPVEYRNLRIKTGS